MKPTTTFAALLAATMIGATAARADTYLDTESGITWTYTVLDETAKTALLGSVTAGADDNATGLAIDDTSKSFDAADIPWVINGYTVTAIGKSAFYGWAKLTGTLTLPRSVTHIYARAFQGCSGLTGLVWSPHVTSIGNYAFNGCSNMVGDISDLTKLTSIGTGAFQACSKLAGNLTLNSSLSAVPTRFLMADSSISSITIPRSVTTVNGKAFESTTFPGFLVPGPVSSGYTTINTSELFKNAKLKVFFAGPNTKADSGNITKDSFLQGITGCKVFVPKNTYWDGLVTGGTDNTPIYYGANTNLNFAIDTDAKLITATPTDEDSLVTVLESAPLFKDYLGMNTRVNITNTIEVASGTITAAMLNAVEFNTMLLTFSVTTQAQLDDILEKFPATTYPMLAIDVKTSGSGKTEQLTLPSNRELWVHLPGDGRYTPKYNGLIISFH